MNLSKAIIISSHIPIFVTASYALLVYKKLDRELKTFTAFVFLTGILQLVSLVLWFLSINNLPVLHLLVALGFLCIAWFYRVISEGFINGRIISITATAFTCFTVLNSLLVQKPDTFNSNALTVESLLVVIFSLSAYMMLLNEIVKEKKKNIKSLNWINTGFFIYYSSSLLIFYFGAMIASASASKIFNRYVWIIHSFFSVIMYTCFFIGIWKRLKN